MISQNSSESATLRTKKNIKIAQLNAQGIDRLPDEVITFCTQKHIDIILLTETYLLTGNLHTTWIQYHTYATQPPNSRRGHGGLSLLIRPDFPHHIHHRPSTNNHTITVSFGKYTIHGLYIPPQIDLPTYRSLLFDIPINPTTIILGDLNTRLGATIGDSRTNNRKPIFEEWQTTNAIINWNQTYAFGIPTLETIIGSSIIDFFLTTQGPTTANEVIIHRQQSLNSDHHLCEATFLLDHDIPILAPPPKGRRQWKLQRLSEPDIAQLYLDNFTDQTEALVTRLTTILSDLPHPHLTYRATHGPPIIDRIANQITNHIYTALDNSVTPSEVRPKHWKWFWTEDLQSLANTRQRYYTKWRNATSPINQAPTWKRYIQAKEAFTAAVKLARAQQWRQFAQTLRDSKGNEVNRYIKRRKKTTAPSPTFSTPLGPKDAADQMRNHLATVFGGHRPHQISRYTTTAPTPSPLPDFFSPLTLHRIITQELPVRKAPGKDHVTTEMIRPIATPLSKILSLLLHLCWQWSYIPLMWRTAQVVPIYKKQDPTDPSNYRPISLTSIFRKLVERSLLPVLKQQMAALDFVQGGFRAQRGSLDQAFNLQMLIREYKRQYDHQPTLAFLDIKQAYDSVRRDIIWTKLHNQGATPELLAILQNMFEEVSIQVIIHNHTSSPIYPTTGVLQGSILSPLLYAIYIDSLPLALRTITPHHPITIRTLPPSTLSEAEVLKKKRKNRKDKRLDTQVSIINATLFADDVALIGSAQDVSTMLTVAESHSLANGYRWSPTKCEIINPSPTITYTLYNQDIPTSTTFKYLGIPFNEYGICKKQLVHAAITKATNTQQALRRNGLHQYGLGIRQAIAAYRTFVRPVLEYGLAIVHLHPTHQKEIQKCQQQCIRLLLNHNNTATSPTAIIEHLGNLPTTKLRTQILQFKFLARVHELPPATLTANVIATFLPFLSRDAEWSGLVKGNNMYTTYKKQKDKKIKYEEEKKKREKRNQQKEKKREEKRKENEAAIPPLAHSHSPYSNPAPLEIAPHSDDSDSDLEIEPPPPHIDSIHTIITHQKDTDHHNRQQKNLSLQRARPPPLPRRMDPILTIPASSKETHRLVKWRMHWLPPHPIPTCPCDSTSPGTRHHYTTQCRLMEPIVIQLQMTIHHYHLPPIPPDLTIIDHLLNLLPDDLTHMKKSSSHWQRTWPLLLSALLTIDINSHPDATFEPEPTTHSWLTHGPPTSTDPDS